MRCRTRDRAAHGADKAAAFRTGCKKSESLAIAIRYPDESVDLGPGGCRRRPGDNFQAG